jgi:hypothetical protein
VLRAHHDTERGVAVKIAAYPAGCVDDTSHPSQSRTHVAVNSRSFRRASPKQRRRIAENPSEGVPYDSNPAQAALCRLSESVFSERFATCRPSG